MQGTLPTILILLIGAVLAVALFRAFRLPTMLAYFLIGVLLGPLIMAILIILLEIFYHIYLEPRPLRRIP